MTYLGHTSDAINLFLVLQNDHTNVGAHNIFMLLRFYNLKKMVSVNKVQQGPTRSKKIQKHKFRKNKIQTDKTLNYCRSEILEKEAFSEERKM